MTFAERAAAARSAGNPVEIAVAPARAELKRQRGLAEIAADVVRGDLQVEAMKMARERAEKDRRGARYLQLRREQGLSRDLAMAQVDREFPDEPKESTDAEEDDDTPEPPDARTRSAGG